MFDKIIGMLNFSTEFLGEALLCSLAGMVGIVVALPCYLLIRTTYQFFKKDLKKGMNIVKETI